MMKITRGNFNAEGVRSVQPRATPWVKDQNEAANSERVRNILIGNRQSTGSIRSRTFANSYKVRQIQFILYPGRCPGLEFANAFGVIVRANGEAR